MVPLLAEFRLRVLKVYFGWWIVGGTFGIEFLLSALLLQAFGTYAAVWREEFGWSATAVALAYSLHRAETGLLGPLQGWLLQRFGTRTIMRTGIIILAAGFLLLSTIQTLTAFYLVFALMAVGGSLTGILSLTTVIVNWFDKKRGTALAIMQSGMSVGGLAVPLIAVAISNGGWRPVSAVSGWLILVLGLLLVQLMRGSPERYGLLPDGAPAAHTEGGRGSPGQPRDPASLPYFTPAEALRTRSFWLLAVGHALAVLVVAAVLVHLVLHLNEGLGYSIEIAAGLFALMTAFAIAGHLVGGWIGDVVDRRTIVMLAMLGHAGALLVLTLAGSLVWVVVFVVVYGFAWGVRAPLMSALRADYFGRRHFPTIMGFASLVVMVGSMTGPILAGALADAYGDYRLAFGILAGTAVVGSVLFLLAAKPPAPARRPGDG